MRPARPTDAPFLKIVIPAAAGVALAATVHVPAWVAAACFAVVFVAAWLTRSGRSKSTAIPYTWLAVMLFFFATVTARTPRSEMPQGERVTMVAQIAENPYARGRWRVTTADVGYFRTKGDSTWRQVNERVQLYIDTCYTAGVGQQIALRGWVNPVDTTDSHYGRLMRLRGEHNRVYLTSGGLLRTAPHVSRTPSYYAARLQDAAVERIAQLRLSPDEQAVVTAMTAGDKRAVGSGLRGSYNATGAAHLLAVSGLHVGIVFLLINTLLYLLPAINRGHIWKNAAAIAAVWAYAAMAGLSPSVVRAALMFSFAQAALASGSHRNALNIMLGSAVVMLALNPNWAGDPSFVLSYTAVLSIAAFFGPVFRLVRSRYTAVNVLTSVALIGLIASLGTAPLVSYWFGRVSLAGILINPTVTLTAYVIVMLGVVWVVAPIGMFNGAFSWALGLAARVQNAVVEWSATLGWASAEIRLPLWGALTIYAAYIALAAWLYNRSREEETIRFPSKYRSF